MNIIKAKAEAKRYSWAKWIVRTRAGDWYIYSHRDLFSEKGLTVGRRVMAWLSGCQYEFIGSSKKCKNVLIKEVRK